MNLTTIPPCYLQPFFNWQNFTKKLNLKDEVILEGLNPQKRAPKKNHQISIFGFQCVAINIQS
jgi:hypothetical protein